MPPGAVQLNVRPHWKSHALLCSLPRVTPHWCLWQYLDACTHNLPYAPRSGCGLKHVRHHDQTTSCSLLMNSKAIAAATLCAVVLLHDRGYGRLRVTAYVKEGLGAWRYRLFASDDFDTRAQPTTQIASLPGNALVQGSDPVSIANAIEASFPELMASALGPSGPYAIWLKKITATQGDQTFEMEEGSVAQLGGAPIATPYK
jgi:hypothetical protein